MSARASIILDGRRAKKMNKFPIKLLVTCNRKVKYYLTIFDLSKEDYGKLTTKHIVSELRIIRDRIAAIETAARSALVELSPFSFDEFERDFISQNADLKQKKRKHDSVADLDGFDYAPFLKKYPILNEKNIELGTISEGYLKYIKKLLQEGRISTASNYHSSHVSLKKFRHQERYSDITPTYLIQYEQWLLSQNLSRSTIGIYIRPLRCIFNEAIIDGVIKKEKCYPFGRLKYQIPSSKNVKKALSIAEVEKIYYYTCDPENPSEKRARDFWLFSYFANGMNIKDIVTLKHKDIIEDYLIFERAKTERAMRSAPRPITIFITDDMKKIMEQWGSRTKEANDYIFPVLKPGLTPLNEYELVQLFVKFVNKWMAEIMKRLNIQKRATTYVARHTFSTVLKRSGVSTEYIQEALGHVDLRTTENYLDSFSMEVKKEFAGKLVSFKR